ncbi:hypothetical protein [Ichthyobacterium seriolicida]|uniref:DUF3575 domain-containing protein n=1 Tax=Ichthyobacterium seriolicida TaxID=242600 RepID=A0A1J1E4Q6_9FLAO|nr:hypothetical protein [Ichthyobacterium seriolicida]BAV95036.1 hypothetical protein JBKA6_1023 [Ichthyobacterium seriolicida]
MRKIFLLLTVLFIFNSSINAQNNPSDNVETKAKNIIKVSASGILFSIVKSLFSNEKILDITPRYERVISDKLSLNIEIRSHIRISAPRLYDYFYSYWGANGGFRYYFSNSAPIGFYLFPSLGYGKIYEEDKKDNKEKRDLLNSDLLVGYQHIITGTSIYIDMALGIRYGVGFTKNDIYKYGGGMINLFSIGYAF